VAQKLLGELSIGRWRAWAEGGGELRETNKPPPPPDL
jgi:hypothetical protein